MILFYYVDKLRTVRVLSIDLSCKYYNVNILCTTWIGVIGIDHVVT